MCSCADELNRQNIGNISGEWQIRHYNTGIIEPSICPAPALIKTGYRSVTGINKNRLYRGTPYRTCCSIISNESNQHYISIISGEWQTRHYSASSLSGTGTGIIEGPPLSKGGGGVTKTMVDNCFGMHEPWCSSGPASINHGVPVFAPPPNHAVGPCCYCPPFFSG